jgi:hypothetical protein
MQVEMYFDFMASRYARNGFLVNVVLIDVWRDSQVERRRNEYKHNTLHVQREGASESIEAQAQPRTCGS